MSIQPISIEALANVVGGRNLPAAFEEAIARRAYGPQTQPRSVEQLVSAGTARDNIVCLDAGGQQCFQEY